MEEKNQKIDGVVSVSYTEMLMTKKGQSKYLLSSYIDELDPIKDKRRIEFLKESQKNTKLWIETLKYIPEINFYKMVLPESHRVKIETNKVEDLCGWSKLLSDVKKNSPALKSLIQGLFGISGNAELDTLSIHNAIGKVPKVVHFFTACPKNSELDELTKLFKSTLKNHIIVNLSGFNYITNAKAEEFVKREIERSKEEKKDGVIILSMNMGARSFSVSEIDAVILLFDNGVVASLIQKISRALTGGIDYNGEEKKEGNIISLSLDPNRIDNVDQFVIEEGIKHKTKDENIPSVIRRIRKSVNIFAIDSNGDPIDIFKDEYWTELLDKYNFNDLKNSQINLLPVIGDEDFCFELLNINASGKERKDSKEKQLSGKGEKFVDKKSKKDSEKKENKTDLKKIRKAIKTINNSILSVAAIDNACFVAPSDRKTFRNIVLSIDSNENKKENFIDLLGIEPLIVIQLMDKEVINEYTIDMCLSKF
jgi:hypothetical protein